MLALRTINEKLWAGKENSVVEKIYVPPQAIVSMALTGTNGYHNLLAVNSKIQIKAKNAKVDQFNIIQFTR